MWPIWFLAVADYCLAVGDIVVANMVARSGLSETKEGRHSFISRYLDLDFGC